MKNRRIMRTVGIMLLLLDLASIAYVFYVPAVLHGVIGFFFPIGLFLMLLLAFYFLILSTRV